MKVKLFRPLRADEIDVRVSRIFKTADGTMGISLLLYKDARVDQNILDEKFGPFGWKREHQLIGDRLYCTVSVKDPETGEWVSKQDVGTESNTEKEKGQASDSFKRACFNWGIGRELYTGPNITVYNDNNDEKVRLETRGQSTTTRDYFKVENIKVENGVITELTIRNESLKKEIFTYPKKWKEKASPQIREEGAVRGMGMPPEPRTTQQPTQQPVQRQQPSAEATKEAARKAVEDAKQAAPAQISSEEIFKNPKELINNTQVDALRKACEERKIRVETVLKLVKAEDPFEITNVQWFNIVLGGKYWDRLKGMEEAEKETA